MSYAIERYPTQLIDVWTLRDGRRVLIRPVLPQDAELEQALVRGLSPTSRYQRFFSPIHELSPESLAAMTQIDYRQHQALIAETFERGHATAIAEARYVIVDAAAPACEFAVVVAEAWRRRGVARRLLVELMHGARAAGLRHMQGDVLATNRVLIVLASSLGFRILRNPGDARLVGVRIDLDALADVDDFTRSDPALRAATEAAASAAPSY